MNDSSIEEDKYKAFDSKDKFNTPNDSPILLKRQRKDFAEWCIEEGISVFPLQAKGKNPALKGKIPYYDCLPTENEITSWFNTNNPNLAIACGEVSGKLLGIDVDDKELAKLLFSKLKKGFTTETARGYHRLVRVPQPVANKVIRLKWKGQETLIHFKFNHEYVVSPYSMHPTGAIYKPIGTKEIPAIDDPDPYQTVLDRLQALAEERSDLEILTTAELTDINKLLNGVSKGERNEASIRIATYYRKQGKDEEETLALCQEWNRHNRPPLEERELESVIRSAFRKQEPYNYLFKSLGTLPCDIFLSDSEWVRKYPNKVVWVRLKHLKKQDIDVEHERLVLKGHFEPLEKLTVDENTFFRVKLEKEFVGNAEQVIREIQNKGMDVSASHLNDTVKAMLSEIKTHKEGHGAIGVYEKNNRLEFCKDPLPYTQQQDYVLKILKRKKVFEFKPKKGDLEAYLKLMDFWHPYEIYPIMGLSVVEPFAPILKDRGYLIPMLFQWDPSSNIGKSLTGKIYSEKLWGVHGYSSEKIDSPYRLQSMLDCVCLPILFEEGERFPFTKYPQLKDACEYYPLTGRGKPDLSEINYFARALPIFTGNYCNLKSSSYMVRFFIVHFDGKAKRQRQQRRIELDQIVKQLKPLGYWLIELGIGWLGQKAKEEGLTQVGTLLKEIEQIEAELNRLTKTWEDTRRAGSWALCYFGLKLWERAALGLGIDWKIPAIPDFFDKVIIPIEQSSFENVELPAKAFIDWWESWKAKNTTQHYTAEETSESVIKGNWEIWKEGNITIGSETVNGEWITSAVLQEYERNRARTELSPIGSMKNLAEGIASLFALPMVEIYGKNGIPQRFSERTKKSVFIPYLEEKK